jgi:cupin 2 domain-containing protein
MHELQLWIYFAAYFGQRLESVLRLIQKYFYTLRMSQETGNLFSPAAKPQDSEQFHLLLQTPHLRLEQIVSYGMPSAGDFWYDQDETEWVLLAKGEAVLAFQDGNFVSLQAGDYLQIAAHQKHRVESCSQDAIWLALDF